jgi:hypothetical protein
LILKDLLSDFNEANYFSSKVRFLEENDNNHIHVIALANYTISFDLSDLVVGEKICFVSLSDINYDRRYLSSISGMN